MCPAHVAFSDRNTLFIQLRAGQLANLERLGGQQVGSDLCSARIFVTAEPARAKVTICFHHSFQATSRCEMMSAGGMACRVVALCGVAWRLVVWCGVVCRGVAWRVVVWCSVSCRGVVWHVVSCRGVAWHVVSCRGVAWYVVSCRGVACRDVVWRVVS